MFFLPSLTSFFLFYYYVDSMGMVLFYVISNLFLENVSRDLDLCSYHLYNYPDFVHKYLKGFKNNIPTFILVI